MKIYIDQNINQFSAVAFGSLSYANKYNIAFDQLTNISPSPLSKSVLLRKVIGYTEGHLE